MLRSGVSRIAAAEQRRESTAALSTPLLLGGMLLLALAVRLLLIGGAGFVNDVSTFEAWTLSLASGPLRSFYASAKFVDYPPGYFFVLAFVGHVCKALVHADPTWSALKVAVKLPAVIADLVDTVLIFALVRRFASKTWAFGAAALFAFNPAIVFISAYWGQVDSVAGGLALGSLLLIVAADGHPGRRQTLLIVNAWLLLAFSILMKPPAIVLVPLYLAYVFTTQDGALRARRAIATGYGIVAALLLAYLSAFAFHAGMNPADQFAWLYGRYHYASGVYPYNSVNAFNLYVAAAGHFWQPDGTLIPNWSIGGHEVGLPQYAWGIALFIGAVLLVVSRYLQRRDAPALVEAAMILSLGYFVLSTRMHERYIFNAVMFATPLIFMRRRYLYAAIIVSLTLLANLYYSLDYLNVMTAHVAGVDPTDLVPWLSRPAALLNVGTFFYLGYVFLGPGSDVLENVGAGAGVALARARAWFSPLEGIYAMRPLDWWLAGGLTVAAFIVTVIGYTVPSEKIFDEIYYARAGEEYLGHKEIFEFTHPPLTKLIITLSMMLFGGLHGLGDTSAGWRFLNLVVGALMVFITYLFAKRLFGSTLFATIAAFLLTIDGFRFAQARIATPEITVAFFTLVTLYAFYRFWIASQVRVAPALDRRIAAREGFALAAGLLLAAGLSVLLLPGQSAAAHVVFFLYLGCGAYAAIRLAAPRFLGAKAMTSYADGSLVFGKSLHTPDGGSVPLDRGAAAVAGAATQLTKNGLVYETDGLRISYARDGSVRYASEGGEALFAQGTMQADGVTLDGRRDGMRWLLILALSAGCLGASKWNGLFDFFVVWLLVLFVVSQRYWAALARGLGLMSAKAAPAAWGNPLGFSADTIVTLMLFVGGTIYALCYIPYFSLHHNVADLVSLQQQMYIYHADTVAKATHPYSSKWWQWPLLQIPISYYYHDFRTGAAVSDGNACCVAEILALPNPLTWWLGLLTVPFMGWIAWREKHKGFTLLFVAYFIQWLPWITSPRITFEYHFFPNLAIIILADTLLVARVWQFGARITQGLNWYRIGVGAFLALSLASFAFFYPVVAGSHISYNAWNARMLTGAEGSNWINPHPGK
ncbi:MAG: glycosyltransferase family 39 protein [Candidatus Eremiobacteraeota bacterium]|nr:glycosyltransferase family 39 protein [Candidatus Eremiobacteraeota bacterium]MBC5821322.1 glycosyltransferase family 39 protein [Candidatus Eremiobacteraeota bacterium]